MGLTHVALGTLERMMHVEVRRVDVSRIGNGFTSDRPGGRHLRLDAHSIYMSIDDRLRRIANQAAG